MLAFAGQDIVDAIRIQFPSKRTLRALLDDSEAMCSQLRKEREALRAASRIYAGGLENLMADQDDERRDALASN